MTPRIGRTGRQMLCALAVGWAAVWSSPALADDADLAAGLVREMSEQAAVVIGAGEMGEVERASELRRLFLFYFEVDLIGRFALGPHWQHATEAERNEYGQLFGDFIVATHGPRLVRYIGETMMVDGARLQGDGSAIVDSRVMNGGRDHTALEWHLRRNEAVGWRVVDLVVEGVSMAMTQRSEFASVIRGNGGSIEALLAAMRQRVARNSR